MIPEVVPVRPAIAIVLLGNVMIGTSFIMCSGVVGWDLYVCMRREETTEEFVMGKDPAAQTRPT